MITHIKKQITEITLLVFALNLFFSDFFLPQKAFVEKVIDGDTILLRGGKTVRYIGIDTPEIRKRVKDKWIYSPQPFSLEAKELNQMLVEKKWIRLEYDVEKKDRYGRLLSYVFVDDIFVNAKLLEEGLAFLYTLPPNVKYVDNFVSLQRKAREEERGIWKIYAKGTLFPEEAKKHVGELAEVMGRVTKIKEKEKLLILIFGQAKKDDFKVVIFRKDFKYFLAQKIDPLTYYTGKKVKVYGKIKYYAGPEIIVTHPSQIEVLE
ncbi:MAG: thermonuclease family protein [Candidatus Omnitrophica bacterium]|nr:thermonuclease family protein [Candidatus Omnitrophota bacterium]